MSASTAAFRIGLRFAPTDARRLHHLAQRARNDELGGQAVSLFNAAAKAAHTGEPLIVHCEHPLEAVEIADGFTLYGINRPAVEALAN